MQLLRLQGWAPRRALPDSTSRTGVARVIPQADIFDDSSIGPGIDLPEVPDFGAMAAEQAALLASLPGFHESAIGFFEPKLDEEVCAYCHRVRRAYEQYASHMNTTHRAALTDERAQVAARLARIGGPNHERKE